MLTRIIVTLLYVMALSPEQTTSETITSGIRSRDLHRRGRIAPGGTKVRIPQPKRVRYTVRLQLPQLRMSQGLGDKSSGRYRELTRTLTSDVEQLYSNIAGDQRVYNMRFSAYEDRDKGPNDIKEEDRLQKETGALHHSADAKLQPLSTPSSSQFTPVKLKQKSKIHPALSSGFKPSTSSPSSSSPSSPVKDSFSKVSSKPVSTPASKKLSLRNTERTQLGSATGTTVAVKLAKSTTSKISTPTTWTTSAMYSTSADSRTFDVALVTRLFKECYRRSSTGEYEVLVEPYIEAYSELLRIFSILGPIFSFVEDDARKKLTKLQNLRKADMEAKQNNYATFQNMFEYEHSPRGAGAKLEGVSSNIWLHRPLKFISGLINTSLDTNSEEPLSARARRLYAETVAPHHVWYIRAAVYVALLSFPSRQSLMTGMSLTDSAEDRQAVSDLSSVIDAVYYDVQGLYDKYTKS